MKLVILAGGKGTRITEESHLKPKPLIEIGGKPIIWHIMKYYSAFGIDEFIICCGYKGDMLKEYFMNFLYINNDIEVSANSKSVVIINKKDAVNWNIKLIDTGIDTMTGGRLKAVESYIDEDNFYVTYGDGLSDIDITKLTNHHLNNHNNIATLSAVLPPSRFGKLTIDEKDKIINFEEKAIGDQGFINGGFFVFNKKVFKYIKDDKTILESDTLPAIAEEYKLSAFKHNGFWHPMDNIRDRDYLNDLWDMQKAPWLVWDD